MADILFTSDRDGKTDIYVSNDDGSGVRRLTDTPFPVGSPKWSPDGSQIAFMMDIETDPKKWQQYDVFIMNADGSQQRNLTEHPQLDGFPAFSPDGKYLVFDSSRGTDAILGIYVMELATRNVRKLTNGLLMVNRSSTNSSAEAKGDKSTSWMPMDGGNVSCFADPGTLFSVACY